jgi:hypothetical protein
MEMNMSRHVVRILSFLAVVLLAASDLGACGDKMLLLGRGARASEYRKTKNPLSILLYKNPTLAKGSGASDFEAALKRVGHKVSVAEDLNRLNQALSSSKVHFVVADPSDMPSLRESVESAPSKPGLVSLSVPPKAKEVQYVALIDEAAKARR